MSDAESDTFEENNEESWRDILHGITVAEEFDFGPEPTIEQFQESQVSYAMYLRLKRLADDLRCHIKDVELLELMRDHWKNPEGETDLNEAANIEAEYIPDEISEGITRLLFDDISTNKEFITPRDIQVFHNLYRIKISSNETRKIIGHINSSKTGKITYNEFRTYLLNWK